MKDKKPDQQKSFSISGIHLAEIRILMNANEQAALAVAKVLKLKGANALEDLDGCTVQNLLHYLSSL